MSIVGGLAMVGVLVVSLAVIAIHVAGAHAAESGTWASATIASQWVHFSAAAMWFGGLTALLIGTPGASSVAQGPHQNAASRCSLHCLHCRRGDRYRAKRRGIDVLGRPDVDRVRAGGAGEGRPHALHRRVCGDEPFAKRAAAAADLRPLRRAAQQKLFWPDARSLPRRLSVAASSRRPVARCIRPRDLRRRFGTTLRVRVTRHGSGGPQPLCRHHHRLRSGQPIDTRRATLRFTPLDDPRMSSSALELVRSTDGAFVGSGSHLAFAGRWRITALIEREGDSIECPWSVKSGSSRIKPI